MGSFPAYPRPIADGTIDLTPVPTGFSNDFANIIGNAGTDQDGFLSIIAGPVQYVKDHAAIMTGLDIDAGDVGVAAAELNTPLHQDFADSLAGFIQQGDPDFNQFSVDLTGNSPPQPTGGGAALPPGCNAVLGFDLAARTPPIVRVFDFAQDPPLAVTMTQIQHTEDSPGLFTVTSPSLGLVPAGQNFPITITLNKTAGTGYHGRVIVYYQPQGKIAQQITLCLGVNVADNLSGSGGGSGGPPAGGGGGAGGGVSGGGGVQQL